MRTKVAFLDRDGVINEKAAAHQYITKWSEFHFKEGAIAGIRLLNQAGYVVVVVTNQRGIARGLMSHEDLACIHQKMLQAVTKKGASIEEIYYCPHGIGECSCRKPGIGLLLQAEKKFAINKEDSFLIGDSLSDIEAGNTYGVASYLLDRTNSLAELVKSILSANCKLNTLVK